MDLPSFPLTVVFALNNSPNTHHSDSPENERKTFQGFAKIAHRRWCFHSTVSNSQQLASNAVGSCGEVKLAVPLVTSGQSTHRGQWPWHVALYLIEGINLSYHCGGSLVSKNKVITGEFNSLGPIRGSIGFRTKTFFFYFAYQFIICKLMTKNSNE